ncbi:hypothetical protein VSVS05_02813 [Vibrio scophthalmi]|nr:hypothetical protein VSVS05_02813 [Vibrio scophthalmi]
MPVAQSLFSQFGVQEVEAQYSDEVTLTLEVEVRQLEAFSQAIINKSGAKAVITPINGK